MSELSPPAPEITDDYVLLSGDHDRRGRRLFSTGLIVLAACLAYFAYKSRVTDTLQLCQGLTIFALSFVPALLWARSGGSRFPVFEPIMLLCANAYAIPLLNGHEGLVIYDPSVITKAAWAVILHQVAAITTYQLTRGKIGEGRFWTEEILGASIDKFVTYGLIASTAYVGVTTFTNWIPAEFESLLRAAFFGIGILCTFINTQRWGRGELSQSEQAVVAGALVLQMALQAVSLLLIGSISLLGIALLGYLSGAKRVPWLAMAMAFAVLSLLHNGKSQMRHKYWELMAPSPTILQVPAFYVEWIGYGLQSSSDNGGTDSDKSVGQKLLERTSLMHMLCLIVNYSPDRQPFLDGETYGYVLPQLVPRLLWPDKPRAHIATYRLAIYYGLQDEEATNNTTISFGMLAEAYANFGLLGGILLGIFWGFSLKKLHLLSLHSPMFSLAGLLMIILTAWSFSSENTMAVWVSSLFQALMVVIGVPLVLKNLFGS